MKRIILLIAICILSAHAINCLEVSPNFSIDFPGKHDEYKIDKLIGVNTGSYDEHYYSVVEFNRDNEGSIDSLTRCVGDPDLCEEVIKNNQCNGGGCWTVPYKEVITKNTIESTITLQSFEGNYPEHLKTYYTDKDSLYAIYFSISLDTYLDTSELVISYIRNDTLYTEEYDYGYYSEGFTFVRAEYTVVDSTQKNTCNTYATRIYSKSVKDTLVGKTWFEEIDNSLIVYSIEDLAQSEYVNKLYYSLRNSEGTTTITKRKVPSFNIEKNSKFDLIGRPAKQKQHIIKVVK